jgi:hypothetical protein
MTSRHEPAEDVAAFLRKLDHPYKSHLLALREIILAADPSIAEGIKWNAPSFRTTEWFATFHLREKKGVRIILHLGAKKREGARVRIPDPEGLLEWLAADRASIVFQEKREIRARSGAFAAIIREWIRHVNT